MASVVSGVSHDTVVEYTEAAGIEDTVVRDTAAPGTEGIAEPDTVMQANTGSSCC